MLELNLIRFVDATSIHSEMLPAVVSGLFCAEEDLLIPGLALASGIQHVIKADLVAIVSPCMREYSIRMPGNIVVRQVPGQADRAVLDFQKTHLSSRISDSRRR